MKFHVSGYQTGDPLTMPAQGVGLNRSADLPETMDVLIVGCGPAGSIAAAQLSQFPEVNTRMIEQRGHRLELANADGVHSRTMETFQAFGFAHEIYAEAQTITDMAFWKPHPDNPQHVARDSSVRELPQKFSEWPMMLITQVRIIDHFNRFMKNAPTRMEPDYGYEFVDFEASEEGGDDYPITVILRRSAGARKGEEFRIRTKYLIGADGARSNVRKSLGFRLRGDQANQAWGVMDVLADTDFPDVRKKSTIKAHNGRSILLIPREGGFLVRLYVNLGEVPEGSGGAVRQTPVEDVIEQAQQIMHPYKLDVKNVVWHSIYEVSHRITDDFDDQRSNKTHDHEPRVFITGDACHTHSAQAGQGMNVSMQDGFNLAWKLGHVVSGNSPRQLLRTYAEERRDIARRLIEFDKQWSSLMAQSSDRVQSPQEMEKFYTQTAEFNAGYLTEYEESMITAANGRQELAKGYPLGRRFKSAQVGRVCDLLPLHIGHEHTADGRWRIYVFADSAAPGESRSLKDWANWAEEALSPELFDTKLIHQQAHTDFDMSQVPGVFKPKTGRFRLTDMENAFGTLEDHDIFDERSIDREGAVVAVRPDQYVAGVFALDDTRELESFLSGVFPQVGVSVRAAS
ncbi:FAD-dependent monooxygenase [Salinisphaera orenii]|uniref:Alkyl hydroperoxide reductase subunit F n=1 Tax=Salinisphaera orenii YIM 95161 TaxID=1051139 RepID=A0A423PDG5_9GAMM|nr:FAD-dependent monooxygenase [Salinisphaera halophila]ROO22686.1 phenol 2-monooxygenase [Salinisphaera halophila YIM 95161]